METGDITRLEKDDFVPADMVIISSSEEDAACFIETADLDGETNLKKKYALAETRESKTPEEMTQLDCKYLRR
jgi:P-type E1-E2 ATPase